MNVHRQRRERLLAACPDWVFVIPGAQSGGLEGNGRPDANLRYLTGHEEPDAILVLRADASILYAPEPDPVRARWWGAMASFASIAERAEVEVRSSAFFESELAAHLRAAKIVGHRLGVHARLDAAVVAALHAISSRREGRVLRPVHDPRGPLGRLRLRKDEDELRALRRAASATVAAHRELAATARAGDSPLALAGRFDARCRREGAVRNAYATLVAAGADATCLHPLPTARPLDVAEWVLVDAGAEIDGYACDVTRTWPVARFDARGELYDAVLDAQLAALAAVRPGTTLDAIHAVAKERLAGCLARLGVQRPLDALFPHSTSHWLGLEVHDAGSNEEVLEPGMCFTVEPGLYIDAADDEAPAGLRGTGVRIEDTVVVTETGVEVLTAAMPKDRASLESLRVAAS